MKIGEIVKRLNDKTATRDVIAEELGISGSTLTRKIKKMGYVYDQVTKIYSLPEPNPELEMAEISAMPNDKTKNERKSNVQKSTNGNSSERNSGVSEINSPKNTQKNSNVHSLSENEIKELKMIIEERKRNIELLNEYKIYDDISKVPIDAKQVRSAFNMSEATTEKLKKYANERRLPLQDLVELAVINLLDQYSNKKGGPNNG